MKSYPEPDLNFLKSIEVDPPSAGSAGHPGCCVGLHFAYVCATDGRSKILEMVARVANRSGNVRVRKSRRSNMVVKTA